METSGQIRLLSDQVINKIAAGEVVERPASVLKELLENAFDSGATEITADIIAGGIRAVTVTDNGTGMRPDDAVLSIERHATSKIRDAGDIERIQTMGFRGEALAAIASVSRMALRTRHAEELSGTEVIVTGGKLQSVAETGVPVGTSVEVRDLFFNTPARRKFLRSEQTELAHLRQLFITFALAHPAVALRMTVDGKTAWQLPGGLEVRDRLQALFDRTLADSLRPVDFSAGDVRIRGYAGVPAAHRADRSAQYVFINDRPASAPLIGLAIGRAYESLIPRGRFPVLFLYVQIDPGQVDVNVHPAKREVRFRKPAEVRDAVTAAVTAALSVAEREQPLSAPMPAAVPRLQIEGIPEIRTFNYPRLPMELQENRPPEPAARAPESGTKSPWAWCRVMGQVGGIYVVLEMEDGMALMDPHAAHERVLYEQYLAEAEKRAVAVQGLLTPENIELNPAEALCVRRNLGVLRDLGFGISEFGGQTYMVDAMPACLGAVSAAPILRDMLSHMAAGGTSGAAKWSREQLAQAACSAAVNARVKLTLAETEKLVVDLARARMPYTSPQGRPTLIFMSFSELRRKFG
ncbi:MAG: DNA mismatch repair endonuclease MutL, partial [Kiritimatiellae bacterium]|nr:DNA mismatch repair endonuclease MutL [Kiritimatiellia bacterium]